MPVCHLSGLNTKAIRRLDGHVGDLSSGAESTSSPIGQDDSLLDAWLGLIG
jgi:hypothetical protein